jgi:hypothetical protein
MYLLFLVSFLLFLWQVNRNASYISESLSDYCIKLFFGLVSCVIPTGFLLSEFNLISQAIAWGVGINIIAFVFTIFFQKTIDNQHFKPFDSVKELPSKFASFWNILPSISKIVFGILLAGLTVVTLTNLIVVFTTVPNEWDSMTGHLVKCAYYIQNGNMNRLGGTTWTIDFYPNSLPTLQIFGYHLFQSEKGFKLIHHLSYWAFALASFGIAKKISKNFTASFFVFLVTALLPTALVQATTTETDIVLTAYLSILTYFMFSFKEKPNKLNISLIAIATGVWFGHKVTFLLIAPAAFVVALHTFLLRKEFYKHIVFFVAVFVSSVCIYALPTGYIGNIKEVGKFGLSSLSAPKEVMMWHGTDPYSGKEILKYGTLNVARYASDFFNLDGIRSTETGNNINEAMRVLPDKLLQKLNLERKEFTVVAPFYLKNAPITFHQERPYWSIISFGMVFPLVLLLFVGFRKYSKTEQGKSLLMLSCAMILHFISLSYTAPYDPIKGRYFMNMAVWAMPLLILIGYQLSIIGKSKLFLFYCLVLTVTISLSAVFVVFNKRIHPIFGQKNIFNLSRMELMTLTRPDVLPAFQKFDELVPKDAIVALGTTNEDFEYPLWGEGFTRTLIPIHPFKAALKPIPTEAQYLFYTQGVLPHQADDIQLNQGDLTNDTPVKENIFYLRKLK